MRRRAIAGKAAPAVTGLSLYGLMMIKPRREARLTHRLAELRKQYQTTLAAQQSCIAQSYSLSLLLERMLSWSGLLTPQELRIQKRKLVCLHVKQQQFTLQQHALMQQLQQQQQWQDELLAELQGLAQKREINGC